MLGESNCEKCMCSFVDYINFIIVTTEDITAISCHTEYPKCIGKYFIDLNVMFVASRILDHSHTSSSDVCYYQAGWWRLVP